MIDGSLIDGSPLTDRDPRQRLTDRQPPAGEVRVQLLLEDGDATAPPPVLAAPAGAAGAAEAAECGIRASEAVRGGQQGGERGGV